MARNPSLHTGMSLFVVNMAVSDVVMCLTAAPLTPITRWVSCLSAIMQDPHLHYNTSNLMSSTNHSTSQLLWSLGAGPPPLLHSAGLPGDRKVHQLILGKIISLWLLLHVCQKLKSKILWIHICSLFLKKNTWRTHYKESELTLQLLSTLKILTRSNCT